MMKSTALVSVQYTGLFLFAGMVSVFGVMGCASTSGQGMGQGTERTILVDGQQVDVETLAQKDYEIGMQHFQAEENDAAKERFERIIIEYSDSRYYGPATLALAQIYQDTGASEKAMKMLEDLLLLQPPPEVAAQARYQLAIVQLALGNQAAAAPTLEKIVEEKETPEERKEAANQLAGELETQGEFGESVRYWKRAFELETDPALKAELEEKILKAVDRDLSFSEVRLLLETEAEPGTLLDELIQYKLARIHIHLKDYVQASERLKTYEERYPQGRYIDEAKVLSGRLQSRVQVQVNRIGVILPLSGPYRSYGQRVLTAIKLGYGLSVTSDDYRGEQTGAGTFKAKIALPKTKGQPEQTRELELIVKDSKGDPEVASELVKELVETDHVIGVIGDILLNTALPVAQRAEDYQVPLISLSRRDGLPELGPWTFRISLTAKKQAEFLAATAMDTMGIKRFAILYPKHPYGVELMNRFWDAIDERQGEVTAIESYSHDQTTFTYEAKSLVGRANVKARGEYIVCKQKAEALEDDYQRKKAGERCIDAVSPIVDFDALLVPDDYRTVSYVIPALIAEDMLLTRDKRTVDAYRKTMKGYARPIQLLGGNMWNNPELASRIGRQIDGALFIDGFNVNDDTPSVRRFVKQFRKVHRSDPGLLEAQSYDAGLLVSALLAGFSSAPPTSRVKLQADLLEVKDFPGVTGSIKFDKNGDSATEARIFMLEKGEIEQKEKSDLPKRGRG